MCFWLVFYVKQVTTGGAVTTTAPISHKADTQNTLLYDFSVDIQVYLESSGYFPVYFVYVRLPKGEKPPPRSGLVDLCLYFHCSLVTRMVF